MKRPGAKVAIIAGAVVMLGVILTLVCVAVAGFIYLRKNAGKNITTDHEGCKVVHTRFDPNRPELIASASPDQQAVLAIDGPPQAFSLYLDPFTGSVVEEWDYFTTGKELYFLDGVFQGGMEVPQPEITAGAELPEPPVYPWEISEAFTPACVVQLTGTALFNTSAVVLPGWNDGYEIARQWMLSGGGSMITVDGNLVLLSIDPGEAIDLDQFKVSDFLIGALGEEAKRLGAILSPGKDPKTYRLSLSPRGQGTTKDGTEIIFDLTGSSLAGEYLFGTDARASVVDLYGNETPAQVNGSVTITRQGDLYEVNLEANIDNSNYSISGLLADGLWKGNDNSQLQALGETWTVSERRASGYQPTFQTTPVPESGQATTPPGTATGQAGGSSRTESGDFSGWQLILEETFDSNTNNWPVTYSTENESVYFQSDLFQDQYLIYAERRSEERPLVERMINLDVGSPFFVSVDILQEGLAGSDCGLMVATKDSSQSVGFLVGAVDREFRVVKRVGDDNWEEILSPVPAAVILTDKVNSIAMSGDEQELILSINGQFVGTVEGTGLDVQQLGLAVSVGAEFPTICYFDNVQVRAE